LVAPAIQMSVPDLRVVKVNFTKDFWQSLPNIIAAAASNARALVVLLVICAFAIALTYFKRAKRSIQLYVFSIFVLLVVLFGLQITQVAVHGSTADVDISVPGEYSIQGSGNAVVSPLHIAGGYSGSLVNLSRVEFDADVVDESARLFGFDLEVIQAGTRLLSTIEPGYLDRQSALDQIAELGARAHVAIYTSLHGRIVGSKTHMHWIYDLHESQSGNGLDARATTSGPAEIDAGDELGTVLLFWSGYGGGGITLSNIHLKLKMLTRPALTLVNSR
jgi:hypothetical protein